MISRACALVAILLCGISGAAGAQTPPPAAATIQAQAERAAAEHRWQEAYSLYLSAASTYITEGNKPKSDEMNAASERVRQQWHDATSGASAPAATGGSGPLWSAFTPQAGTPRGSYSCTTMVERLVGMSSPGGVGGMPLRVPQTMFLGSLRFTPGHYAGPTSTPGTWSGSGASLHLSGKPYNTAQAEYGVNGRGRSTVRFTWHADNARPQVWMCVR